MVTMTEKQFRLEFRCSESWIYISAFNFLKKEDPLFPRAVGKLKKEGGKKKMEVWDEEDVSLYVKYIIENEKLKRDRLLCMMYDFSDKLTGSSYEFQILKARLRVANVSGKEHAIDLNEARSRLKAYKDKLVVFKKTYFFIDDCVEESVKFMYFYNMVTVLKYELHDLNCMLCEVIFLITRLIRCVDLLLEFKDVTIHNYFMDEPCGFDDEVIVIDLDTSGDERFSLDDFYLENKKKELMVASLKSQLMINKKEKIRAEDL